MGKTNAFFKLNLNKMALKTLCSNKLLGLHLYSYYIFYEVQHQPIS